MPQIPNWNQAFIEIAPAVVAVTPSSNYSEENPNFSDYDWAIIKNIPNAQDLHWEGITEFLKLSWMSPKTSVSIKLVGSQHVFFGLTLSWMPGCCGLLLLNHIESNYDVPTTASLIKCIMNIHGSRGHLYITRYGPTTSKIVQSIELIGKKMFTFGNTFHENKPLHAYLCSTNIELILNPSEAK